MALARSPGSGQYSDLQIVGAGSSSTRGTWDLFRCNQSLDSDTFTSSFPWGRRSKGGVRE